MNVISWGMVGCAVLFAVAGNLPMVMVAGGMAVVVAVNAYARRER